MTENGKEDNGEVPDWATDPEFIHRFWRRVVRDVDVGDCDTPCHIYVGNKSLDVVDIHEYQRVYIPAKYDDNPKETIGVHRVVYSIDNRVPLNKELVVHHDCNIKAGVNSSHLRKISLGENVQLAHRDGLGAYPDNQGEQNGFADLTEDEVLEIHHEFHTTEKSTREIAAEFGIDPGHTRRILQGRAWPHTYEKICEEFPEDDRRPVTNRGQHNGLADFTAASIRELFRDRFQRGLTTHELAERYDTTERYVRKILNRKRWGHIEVTDIPSVPDNIKDRPDEATSPGPKLTPDYVKLIFRDRYGDGDELTYEELGEKYGVSGATIGRVLNRRIWSDVDISDIDAVPDDVTEVSA